MHRGESFCDVLLIKRRRLGAELRRLREQAGLSGRQLAEQVGISQSKISRIESGATVPNTPEVNAWAAAVNAPPSAVEKLLMLTDAAYTEAARMSLRMDSPVASLRTVVEALQLLASSRQRSEKSVNIACVD